MSYLEKLKFLEVPIAAGFSFFQMRQGRKRRVK